MPELSCPPHRVKITGEALLELIRLDPGFADALAAAVNELTAAKLLLVEAGFHTKGDFSTLASAVKVLLDAYGAVERNELIERHWRGAVRHAPTLP